MIDLLPSEDYAYAFRRGMQGSDVAVLQLNLGDITVDGDFGPQTEKAVRAFQYRYELVEDGIAGIITQRRLIVLRSAPAAKAHELPGGILKSITSNECGFAIACATRHLNTDGWDIGAFQRSTGSWSQAFLWSAFNVAESAEWTAKRLSEVRDSLPLPVPSKYLTELADGDKGQFLWQLAVLNHNWPVAAHNIATKGFATSDDDAPAQWIIDATEGGLRTPREWCMRYITRATVYAEWNR